MCRTLFRADDDERACWGVSDAVADAVRAKCMHCDHVPGNRHVHQSITSILAVRNRQRAWNIGISTDA